MTLRLLRPLAFFAASQAVGLVVTFEGLSLGINGEFALEDP